MCDAYLQIAFEEPSDTLTAFGMALLVPDILFLVDIALNFFTTYFDDADKLVLDHVVVFKTYFFGASIYFASNSAP